MSLAKRYDVPNFRDRALLEELVKRWRIGIFNFFTITGVCLILFGGFVGWVFSAKEYLRMREYCDVDARGLESARDLCVARETKGRDEPPTEKAIEEKCGRVSTTLSAHEYCMRKGSEDDHWGEVGQFGLGAGIAGFVGVLCLLLGIRDRRSVPEFVKVLRDPSKIVWIFESDAAVKRGISTWVFRTVRIGTDSGELTIIGPFRASFEGMEDPDVALSARVMSEIIALAPAASVGFSDELLQRFRQNPRSLVQARAHQPTREMVAA